MLILIIGLIILAGIAMAVGVLHNRQIQKKIESGELKTAPEIVEADAECCGQHEICEKESLLAAVSKKIEYYDDEELGGWEMAEAGLLEWVDKQHDWIRDALRRHAGQPGFRPGDGQARHAPLRSAARVGAPTR